MGFRIILALAALAAPAHAAYLPGMSEGRSSYLATITREANAQGVPPAIADAVAMVETAYRADARGSAGEIGIMQILPATAAGLGFRGSIIDLYNPETNIHLGVQYLARAWAMSGGDICRALMKYRAGLAENVISPLSAAYCTRAISWLTSTNSLLGNGITAPAGFTPLPQQPASPPSDPYVVAVIPALAAQARLRPTLATTAYFAATPYPRRTWADRTAALNARFESHLRHLTAKPNPAPTSSDN
jgi:soluble lytic murein transglycosylase-like protein